MVSTYFLNCIMGNLFRSQTSPALPASYYVGLSLTEPQANGTGVREPSDSGYARLSLANVSVPSNGIVTNTEALTWEEVAADWGTVTHFVIYDQLSGGNLLCGGKFPKPRTIQEGMTVIFQPDALRITLKDAAVSPIP